MGNIPIEVEEIEALMNANGNHSRGHNLPFS